MMDTQSLLSLVLLSSALAPHIGSPYLSLLGNLKVTWMFLKTKSHVHAWKCSERAIPNIKVLQQTLMLHCIDGHIS